MGRERQRKLDPLVDDFEKLRTLDWSDPHVVEAELEYLLDDPQVRRVGKFPEDPLKRVRALKRLLQRWVESIYRREAVEPPPYGRSLAFAAETLLRLGTHAESVAGDLYEAIGERWLSTRGERRGEPIGDGFRTHHLARTYERLAADFGHFIRTLSLDATATSQSRPTPTRDRRKPPRAQSQSPPEKAAFANFVSERLGWSPQQSVLTRVAQNLGHHDAKIFAQPTPQYVFDSWDECLSEFVTFFQRRTRRAPFAHAALLDRDVYVWLAYLLRRCVDGVPQSEAQAEAVRLLRD